MARLWLPSVISLSMCAAAWGCSLSSGYTSDPATDQTSNEVNKGESDAGTSSGEDGGGGGSNKLDSGEGIAPDPDASQVQKSTFCTMDAGGSLLACDDFDESPVLAGNWGKDEQGAGTIALDTKDCKSAPNSVLASLPAHTTNYIYHDVGLQTGVGNGAFAMEFDLNTTADMNASGSNIAVNYACPLQITSDQREYVSICYGKTEAAGYVNTFNSQGTLTTTKVPMSVTMPQGSWHHFKVTFTFAASGSVTIEMDGAKVGGFTGMRTADPKAALQYVYPEIGLETDGQWGATTARFDNVRLTQQ